ncbi:hypothetical protein D3C80_1694200 [compost metagenome]
MSGIIVTMRNGRKRRAGITEAVNPFKVSRVVQETAIFGVCKTLMQEPPVQKENLVHQQHREDQGQQEKLDHLEEQEQVKLDH